MPLAEAGKYDFAPNGSWFQPGTRLVLLEDPEQTA